MEDATLDECIWPLALEGCVETGPAAEHDDERRGDLFGERSPGRFRFAGAPLPSGRDMVLGDRDEKAPRAADGPPRSGCVCLLNSQDKKVSSVYIRVTSARFPVLETPQFGRRQRLVSAVVLPFFTGGMTHI